jgi:hypothetical protein
MPVAESLDAVAGSEFRLLLSDVGKAEIVEA